MKLFKKDFSLLKDELLLEMMSKGNKDAFDEIYKRYASAMHFFFSQKLKRDKEKAEDFVHDLFAKIIKNPDAFDTKRSFKTWFYSVANNMVKNEYKKMEVRSNTSNNLDVHYDIESIEMQVDEQYYWKDFSVKLKDVVSEVESKHSEVFELRHFQDMSIKEIAEVLSINEGTVKSRLFHAHKKIAAKLHEFNPKLKD